MVLRPTRVLANSALLKKFFSRTTRWDGSESSKRVVMVIVGVLGLSTAATTYFQLLRTDSEDRLNVCVGWRGEHAQDFVRIGQPPLNLNLPPHMRTDMKSYLDLPETVVRPPPAWSALHPYLRERYKLLFLDPPENAVKDYEWKNSAKIQMYGTRTPWGESLEDVSMLQTWMPEGVTLCDQRPITEKDLGPEK
eukprot:TRINITY_DN31338_c0_g1_i1.p1 TRINITY_DN31338_c0_g1~~TRINITY_DN31338_c0_g1_i1.p1  ORF type:complete len:193 (+),score=38.67 TRINITY_DN31338_c0_g1_i1:69-647(+)